MNFTKEYIELCKSKYIQYLRPMVHKGDWFYRPDKDQIDVTKFNNMMWGICVWLPTGDQLDEEIIKICKENNSTYSFWWLHNSQIYSATYHNSKEHNTTVDNVNPLIAKISLLIKLLERKDKCL